MYKYKNHRLVILKCSVVTRNVSWYPTRLDSVTVHLHDVSDLWNVYKLVHKPLPVHFGQDSSLIVIPGQENPSWKCYLCCTLLKTFWCLPESSTHGLVVHVWLVLVQPPQPGHRLAVHQLEDALLPVAPLDELGTAVFILEQRWYRK